METKVKERPIIFSASMVRAILEWRKTQTRRIMKHQPSVYVPSENVHPPKHASAYFDAYCNRPRTKENPRGMSEHWCWWTPDDRQGPDWIRCPYGRPGDRLWVREAFYIDHTDYDDRQPLPKLQQPVAVDDDQIFYPADARDDSFAWCCQLIPECSCGEVGKPKLRSPIFMPRWASRITLEITEVRVQRVRDITESDAIAEGMLFLGGMMDDFDMAPWADPGDPKQEAYVGARGAFSWAWARINGKDSWNNNSWVWAITFKRVDGEA